MKEANTKNQRYLLAYEKHILKNGTPQEMEELKKLKKEKKRKYAPRKLTQEQRDGLVTDSILSVNLQSIMYLLGGQFNAPFPDITEFSNLVSEKAKNWLVTIPIKT